MPEKYSARELTFHYLARLPDKLSEEAYLEKLVEAEAKFTELLAKANPPDQSDPLETWTQLGQRG